MSRVIEPRKAFESEEPRRSSCAIGHGARVDESSETQAFLSGSESTAHAHRSSARKPGDLDGAWLATEASEERGEGPESHNPEKYADEESDEPVVPEKSPNSRVTPEEAMEGRGEAEGKPADGNTLREQTREGVLTIVERVGERAKQKRGEKFTTLLSHVKVPWG